MDIRPLDTSESAIHRYMSLFEECFPASALFTEQYLRWLYRDNPEGHAFGFDSWDGDTLTAHYATIPVAYISNGKRCRALLSLNTATHPAFRNKGLFVRLASSTYEAAASAGFDFVVGVANANSTPGFTRKLGFSLISPLIARVGFGLSVDEVRADLVSDFSAEALKWRLSSPRNPVYTDGAQKARFWAATPYPAIYAVTSRAIDRPVKLNRRTKVLSGDVFLGLLPKGAQLRGTSFELPKGLRPSPLNFIFLALNSKSTAPNASGVRVDFLDFDAF